MFIEVYISTSTGFQVDRFYTPEEAKKYVRDKFDREGVKIYGDIELNKEYIDVFKNKVIVQPKEGEMPANRTYWEDSGMGCFYGSY